ncbi:MAG TPA: E2/UBC family protein [Candidatus Acidoferrales bacterium]|nr:E2/UBC family protein [Candidatus Acidoferrales bacterium]
MALPPALERELEDLRQYQNVEVVEQADVINLILKNFGLGEGYNPATADLLLRIPRSYPDAGPDMFWLNPRVTLVNGACPQAADANENHLGRTWQRFSWHRSQWKPAVDNIHGQIEFIRKRLRERH